MNRLIYILFIFICGCGGMNGYIIINDKGIDGNYKKGEFKPNENPIVYIKTNRPSVVKVTKDNSGKIEASIDATNKNNMDKAIEGLLPLIALKKA